MWLTYRQAARRVRRSVNTIRRWRRQGMPMRFDAQGRRIVHVNALQAAFRRHLLADPIMQAKRRAAARMEEVQG